MTCTGRIGLLVLAGVSLLACSKGAPTLPSLVRATDEDPAPDTVRISLKAAQSPVTYGNSPSTPSWTYNGTVPGPLIDAEVGQRLVVQFTNTLPEATTIHWHGVRLPATMDGTLVMQKPIQPGESFVYDFVLKDPGLYWFHPHMRSDIQVQKGLYGVLRVKAPDEPVVDDELVVVLDDIRLKADGSISEYLDDTSMMLGREGNTLLVNGAVLPRIPLKAGAVTRLRLVNVANARFFNLSAPGITWRLLGSDGSDFATAQEVRTLLLVPGERYDVVFRAPAAGEVILSTEPYARGHMSGTGPPLELATFVSTAAPASGIEVPGVRKPRAPLIGGPSEFKIALSEKQLDGQVSFLINGAAWPNVAPWAVDGGTHTFEVVNDSEMDHPFHLHGTFFQVLERDGKATDVSVAKDTINVPAKSSFKAAAKFDEPGRWMYHCHILEHAEGGMMGEISVK